MYWRWCDLYISLYIDNGIDLSRMFNFVSRGSSSQDERFYNRAFRAVGCARRMWRKLSRDDAYKAVCESLSKLSKNKESVASAKDSAAKSVDGSGAMPCGCVTVASCLTGKMLWDDNVENITLDPEYDVATQIMAFLVVASLCIDFGESTKVCIV